MSETKKIIPADTVKKLKHLSKNIDKFNIGRTNGELWISTSEASESYDWDQYDVGINKEGELITCSQGGCSCNSPEAPTADNKYQLDGEVSIEDDAYSSDDSWLPDLIAVTNTLYDVLKGKKVSAETVIELPNAEVRRAVIELIGMDNFIKNANPEVLDENEIHGTLLKVKLEGDEDLVLLHVKDPSTTREYFLRVPPEMKSSAQARAWGFGFNTENFVLEKET